MITCPHCSKTFKGSKLNARHLSICDPSSRPEVPPCLCGHEATSLTQMKRHRKDCETWQTRDTEAVAARRRKKTNLARHGVEDASQAPEVRARRAATNEARYGAVNPFCKESSVFDKVQESLEGKRFVWTPEDNPFAQAEVQEKIKEHWLQEHGVENPQQVPEIRAQTRATMEERCGGELLASPEIRAKAETTNLERYGAAFAGGTPEVQAKVIKTNMERYGVPHTCMDPGVRRRQLETMESNYGGHFFASEEGQAVVRAAMLENHGVEFPGQIEGHWERALATFKTHYPNLAWPGMLARPQTGPNGLENLVRSLAPPKALMFTGDRTWWRWLPKIGHHKNPDFIVPGPDPKHPRRGVTKVVEAFGSYWHSRIFTGKAPFAHETELIEAFAEIGIECLVLWESEVKSDPEAVRERLVDFLAEGDSDEPVVRNRIHLRGSKVGVR